MSGQHYPTTTPDWRAAVQRRTRFYTLAAVLLAVLFGLLTFQFFRDQQAHVPGEQTWAVFAGEDLPPGSVLNRENLRERKIPESFLPAAYFPGIDPVVGKKLLYPVNEGEVITPSKLIRGKGGPVAQRCPSQRWCVRVPASWFAAHPPEVSPGDRLEIASAYPGQGREKTGFIAADVLVVAVLDASEPNAYVLALEDDQALSLLFARVNEYALLVLLEPSGG